jgi:hypothetical protein
MLTPLKRYLEPVLASANRNDDGIVLFRLTQPLGTIGVFVSLAVADGGVTAGVDGFMKRAIT